MDGGHSIDRVRRHQRQESHAHRLHRRRVSDVKRDERNRNTSRKSVPKREPGCRSKAEIIGALVKSFIKGLKLPDKAGDSVHEKRSFQGQMQPLKAEVQTNRHGISSTKTEVKRSTNLASRY
jgi:hypothetical protein